MQKISQLPAATSVGASDLFAIVQSSVTKKATSSLVLAYVQTNITIAQTQVTNLTTDLAGKLAIAQNLADLNNVVTARTNLGLGSAALIASPVTPVNGGSGVASPTAHTLPVAEGASNYTFLGPLTNGQLLIGATGLDPIPGTLSAGPGISISNSSGSITISGTGSGTGWTEVTGTTQAMAADNGYVVNNGSLVTLTLPTTAAFGTAINIVGKGAGGWLIAQNASQIIQLGSSATTTGVGGSIASSNQYDSIELICTTANLVWTCMGGAQGNITIV
jgi:hypothetical protein